MLSSQRLLLTCLHTVCTWVLAAPDQRISISVPVVILSLTAIPALLSAVELLWCGWGSGTVHLGHLPRKGYPLNPLGEGKFEEQDLVPLPVHSLEANPTKVESQPVLLFQEDRCPGIS